MTKTDAIQRVADETGVPKEECTLVVDTFLDEVVSALCIGDKVSLRGFATFEIKDRTTQYHRNPATNEVQKYPPVRVVRCNMSQSVKDMINKRR